MPHDVLMALLGAAVGGLLALTGAGGGAVAVPLLVFVAGLPMQSASPAALVAVGLSALLGAFLGLRQGVVRYRAAGLIGAVGMLGAPLGVWLAQRLPQAALLLLFAAFMLLTAWRMLKPAAAGDAAERRIPCERPDGEHRLRWTPHCAVALARIGGFAGLLSGLLGVGGGFVIVPALERHTNLDLRSIQATSLSVIALVSISGVSAALWHGQVQAAVAVPFAGGALAGLLLGRGLAARLSTGLLRRGFAVLTLGMAGMMVWRGVALLH